MKKNIFFILSLAFLFSQCDKQEFDPVLSLNSPPTWSSPSAGTSFVFTEEMANDTLSAFSWTAADFGFNAGTAYTIQVDVAGNDFADAVSIVTVNALSYDELLVNKLNSILIAKNVPDGVASNIEIRVCGKVADSVDELCSETLTISVTPYKSELILPTLNVPGSYQGWDPMKESTAIYSAKSDDKYAGYVYIAAVTAAYKFALGSWDDNWGDTGADGTLDNGGDDIMLGNAVEGMYFLTADLVGFTHTSEARNWGIIGAATPTGWDSDTDMVWDAAREVLSITIDMVAGPFKFRANDDWAHNLGDPFGNGKLTQDGADIMLDEAGNYTIDLIMTNPELTYELTKN